jgi:predicted nucleic acid-binding protein
MTEILQGIRSDKEYDRIKNILSGLLYLPITKNIFIHASSIYRTIRKHGKTIRSPIDCIIAAICIEHEIELLHNDKDFSIIAQYTSLRILS